LTTLNSKLKITEGTDAGLIGTAAPTGAIGIQPAISQVGFYVFSTAPYTIWFYDENDTWVSHQSFTSGTLMEDGTGFAWDTNQAVYFQVSNAGDSLFVFPRANAVMIDGDVSDGTNQRDTLVQAGNPSPVDVQVAPIKQFTQWNDTSGHIIPSANAQFDIGSAEYKVRHFYLSSNSMYIGDTWIKAEGDQIKTPNLLVGDINLNNAGRQNEVDGTSGHWSIQEGAEDLFLINRNTGKKYKFNLTEVE